MSSNNFLKITEGRSSYKIEECDADEGRCQPVAEAFNLRQAIIKANKYQKEMPVEYGLHIVLK